MIKREYKRYLMSKFNLLIIFFLLLLTVINFYGTYVDQLDLQYQIATPAEDLNIKKAQEMYNSYNGLTYLGNLLFSSDYYVLAVIVLLMGLSAVIGDVTYKNLRNGYGNLLVLRCGYKPYLTRTLVAQCAYISTFVGGYFLVLAFVSMVLFGIGEQVTMNIGASIEILFAILYLCTHLLLLILYLCMLFVICSLSTALTSNKYLIQLIPLILYVVPMLLASTIGNVGPFMASFFSVLNSDSFLFYIRNLLTAELAIWQVLLMVIGLPTILLCILVVLYRTNCIKYQKGYL